MEILLADSPEEYVDGATQVVSLSPGESLEIWPGRVHQIRGLENSELFEFSTHHEESDSYRIVKGD
jgi:mannose-6-phosphate isomerase-like protein (cupin superfamily)